MTSRTGCASRSWGSRTPFGHICDGELPRSGIYTKRIGIVVRTVSIDEVDSTMTKERQHERTSVFEPLFLNYRRIKITTLQNACFRNLARYHAASRGPSCGIQVRCHVRPEAQAVADRGRSVIFGTLDL